MKIADFGSKNEEAKVKKRERNGKANGVSISGGVVGGGACLHVWDRIYAGIACTWRNCAGHVWQERSGRAPRCASSHHTTTKQPATHKALILHYDRAPSHLFAIIVHIIFAVESLLLPVYASLTSDKSKQMIHIRRRIWKCQGEQLACC